MTARVYCESGGTVKLRKTPSLKESLYWDIPDQTEVILLEKGERWSRIQALGHSRFMLSNFLKFEDESVPITVTLTMEQKMAQSLLPVLDSLVSQLESAVGRG